MLIIFFFTSGPWLGVQLVEMTGIFFPVIPENKKFSTWVSVPSTLTQDPDCPSTLLPRSANFSYACIFHVVSQHHSWAGPTPQTPNADEFTWKTHSFLNSWCLDLSNLSDLPQLTPFHLAYFSCLFVHFVVVFFINEILIDSLCDVSYASSFFSSPDKSCWT